MKKYLLIASIVALSAAAVSADSHNMTGPYVGVNIGYGMGSGDGKMKSVNVTALESVEKSDKLGLKGFRGGFHLGYGKVFTNKLFIGLEASADFSGTDGKVDVDGNTRTGNTRTQFHFDAKRRDAFGLAAHLGGMLGGMLTYAKVGVETAKWKFNASQNNYLGNADNTSSNNSKNERLTGFVFGLGMATMATKNIMVGAEWTYTRYRNSSTLEVTRNGTSEKLQFNLRPSTNDFRVRLSYKW